jgi:hypothetical protein
MYKIFLKIKKVRTETFCNLFCENLIQQVSKKIWYLPNTDIF